MREGSCPCGTVHFTVDGPVRDVLVCHCEACVAATGGPWAASAARRADLQLTDPDAVRWERAAVSEHDASRGSCRACGTVVFWDAPGRETVSFGVSALAAAADLVVVADIWTGPGTMYPAGLPGDVEVRWRD